jgi:peptidase inhibitor family I36
VPLPVGFVRKAVVGAAALALVGAVSPLEAQAATGYARCPANRMCVFSGTNGSGVMASFARGDGNLADSSGPRGLNNNIESVYNRRNEYWGLFNNKGYSGGVTLVEPHAKGTIAAKYRNLATSLKNVRG